MNIRPFRGVRVFIQRCTFLHSEVYISAFAGEYFDPSYNRRILQYRWKIAVFVMFYITKMYTCERNNVHLRTKYCSPLNGECTPAKEKSSPLNDGMFTSEGGLNFLGRRSAHLWSNETGKVEREDSMPSRHVASRPHITLSGQHHCPALNPCLKATGNRPKTKNSERSLESLLESAYEPTLPVGVLRYT